MIDRSVRLSQTLVPFGVGAVYDILGESFVAADISYWKNRGDVLRAPRLEHELQKERFKAAPSHTSLFSSSGPGVPYVRFPKWLFCPSCRHMVLWRWAMEREGEPATCNRCAGTKQLVPMRFVMACENGHLADVPWDRWAHSRAKGAAQKQCQSKDLRYVTKREAGAGLETLFVECGTCHAQRSLAGITATGSLEPLRIRCPGTQPWQRMDSAEECDRPPRVLQRGASNIYFARTSSSIDIPPESSFSAYSDIALKIQSTAAFDLIMSAPNGPLAPQLKATLAEELGCSVAEIETVVSAEESARRGEGPAPEVEADDLQAEEWRAFLTPQPEHDDRDRFITEELPLLRAEDEGAVWRVLEGYIDRVVVARKLREVRALVGFTRYESDGRLVTPDLDHDLNWLPAVEVFGEGIFLSLNEAELSRWEIQEAAVRDAKKLEVKRQSTFLAARFDSVTPRFILLHTLAHLLIRQLAYESGYAAASLRERIYARAPDEGEPQAGILIYTAAGDVEGTLGGLARQGEPPRFARTVLNALHDAVWCSSDPLCRESRGQGFASLNLAACHACALLSETSCTYSNSLLDRTAVIGTPETPRGYFSAPLETALNLTAETLHQ